MKSENKSYTSSANTQRLINQLKITKGWNSVQISLKAGLPPYTAYNALKNKRVHKSTEEAIEKLALGQQTIPFGETKDHCKHEGYKELLEGRVELFVETLRVVHKLKKTRQSKNIAIGVSVALALYATAITYLYYAY